jgi:vacuolar-type H+-ATPase subunit E/Vma4
MALEDITKKIRSDSENAIGLIRNETESAISALANTFSEKEKRHRDLAQESLKNQIAEQEKKVISAGNLATRLKEAAARRKILDSVYLKAHESLCSLPTEKYSAFIEKLLKNTPKAGRGKMFVPVEHINIFKAACRKLKLPYDVVPDKSLKGGFRLDTDGLFYDASFDRLVQNAKETSEIEIGNFLFWIK